MRMIIAYCFGFVLAAAALALPSAPASAFEIPAVTVTTPSNIVKVDEEDRREYREHEERRDERREREEREAREHHEHCEHARHECHERHGDGHEFRECVERRGC